MVTKDAKNPVRDFRLFLQLYGGFNSIIKGGVDSRSVVHARIQFFLASTCIGTF